jgi:ubiquinone/menaquinone biosynthesis C-methylase UbiE
MVQLPLNEWHLRYVEQAEWTSELRAYLVGLAGLNESSTILDVGCGSGVLIDDLDEVSNHIHGLDISFAPLEFSKRRKISRVLIQGAGQEIPILDDSYDLVFCHFLLLWTPEPTLVVKEMTRVAKPGGRVIAFAEPDYGGRIDFPEELSVLAENQISALIEQGANPNMGRRLASIFTEAGLSSIRTGVIGGEWGGPPNWKEWESEWMVLESDLTHSTRRLADEELYYLKSVDKRSYEQGKRILYVPTFYASGVVKGNL